MTSSIVMPGGGRTRSVSEVLRDAGLTADQPVRIDNWLTPSEVEQLRAIENSHFFLVRNDGAGTGERYECNPKKAALQALKLARQSGDPIAIAEAFETLRRAPEGCGRKHTYFTLMCVDQPFRGLRNALIALATVKDDTQMLSNILEWAPDMGEFHPETARKWKPDIPNSRDLLGVVLGYAEPITQRKAEQLASLIQSRRPPRPFIL